MPANASLEFNLSIPKRDQLLLLVEGEVADLLEVHAEPEEEALLEVHHDEVVVVKKFTGTKGELFIEYIDVRIKWFYSI